MMSLLAICAQRLGRAPWFISPSSRRKPQCHAQRRRALRTRTHLWLLLVSTHLSAGSQAQPLAPNPSPTAASSSAVPPRWEQPKPPPWPTTATTTRPVRVQVIATIDRNGRISQMQFPEPAPPTLFRSATERFLRAQTFVPATRDGQALTAQVQIQLDFSPPAPLPPARSQSGPAVEDAEPQPASHPPPADAPQPPPLDKAYSATAQVGAVAEPPPATSTSDFHIRPGTLRTVPRHSAMALLTLSPGVLLTNHSGEGHAPTTYLRGFDAGEGQDLEIRVQGIPINEPSNAHGHGYADTHFVIPELVDEVHVQQGPFDARQGDFSAAGSVEFHLRAPAQGIVTHGALGSFGRQRLLVAWSPTSGDLDTFAGMDVVQGDGFGPNRAHRTVRGLAQWSTALNGTQIKLLSAHSAQTFDSAGVVRQDAVDNGSVQCGGQRMANFYCWLDANQGGQADRHLVSLRLDTATGHDGHWHHQVTLMQRNSRFRENFTGALVDERGDGLDQQTRMLTMVAQGGYRLTRRALAREQRFAVGYETRHDRGQTRMWRLRSDGQVPHTTVFDSDVSLTHVAAYATSALSFTSWLKLQLGVRSDTFGYEVSDQGIDSTDREGERLTTQTINAWGTNIQPRATLTLGPVYGVRWISSLGGGARSSDAQALSEGELSPFSKVWAVESGLAARYQVFGSLKTETRAAFFYSHVNRDLLFDQEQGRNVTIGATARYGAYGHQRLRYRNHLDVTGSITWAEARYAADDSDGGHQAGDQLPFVPRLVFRSDAVLRDRWHWFADPLDGRIGLGISWVGPRPLPLGTESAPIFTLDGALSARYLWAELSFSATNLTNRRNRSQEFFYASDFGTTGATLQRVRHFTAAAPRRYLLGLTLYLDP